MAKVDAVEWIPTFNSESVPESSYQRLRRKCTESPSVPIAIGMTIGALSFGLYNFIQGSATMQQYGMRARVSCQAMAFVAILHSMYTEGKKRKEKDRIATANAKL